MVVVAYQFLVRLSLLLIINIRLLDKHQLILQSLLDFQAELLNIILHFGLHFLVDLLQVEFHFFEVLDYKKRVMVTFLNHGFCFCVHVVQADFDLLAVSDSWSWVFMVLFGIAVLLKHLPALQLNQWLHLAPMSLIKRSKRLRLLPKFKWLPLRLDAAARTA